MRFKEWLLTEKYQRYGSAMCIKCKEMLIVSNVAVNKRHIYHIGQLWECHCRESKMWTNSIRNPERLLAFLNGKEEDYHNGFCNDLFCGHCFHTLYPLKNAGIKIQPHSQYVATLYGSLKENGGCGRATIAIDVSQELKEAETEPILQWYKKHRRLWEPLI